MANDVAWFKSGGFKAQEPTLPPQRYLDMRQECGTFKSVAYCPGDWLLLVLAMRARGDPLTKTDDKIDESSKAFGDWAKTIQHSLHGR